MNASRLLFEGLEDRILLSGLPAALIASLPHYTETYNGSITSVVADASTTGFTLPKFNDLGGLRILVGAVLTSSTTTTTGTYNVYNADEFDGTVEMSLDMNVESNVVLVSPTSLFNFTKIANASTTAPIAVGQTVSVTLPAYASGPQVETALYPSSELADFTAAPGDSTIQFDITTSSYVDHTADVGVYYYSDPLIHYTMTGQVTYEYVMVSTDENYYDAGFKYEFKKPPAPTFQPFYSGTAQPGATLEVDVLGPGGEVLGSTSTIVDAGGNWAASFYDLGMTGGPHSVSIRQSYPGDTPLTGAGYNLRRYFSPAILGGAYASEHLTIENVLGNRDANASMAALYSASANPITLGPSIYAYDMLPMSASPQGLH